MRSDHQKGRLRGLYEAQKRKLERSGQVCRLPGGPP